MSDLKAKIHQNQFQQGLRPRSRWGANSVPRPLVVFKGPTSKGGGRQRKGRRGKGKRGKRKGGKDRETKGRRKTYLHKISLN